MSNKKTSWAGSARRSALLLVIAAAVNIAWFVVLFLWMPHAFFPYWPAPITMGSGVVINLAALVLIGYLVSRRSLGKGLPATAAVAAASSGAGAGMWFVPDPGGLRITDLFMVAGGMLVWIIVLSVSIDRALRAKRSLVEHAPLRGSSPEVHVVYVKNTETHEEKVIQVVAREEDARALETMLGLAPPQTLEWETIEIRGAIESPVESGDTIYLLSEGGPSDEAEEEHSPNAVAAFVTRESVNEFLQDPRNHEYMVDLRLRTLRVGVPLD